jgi:hypothetical protein
MPMQPATPLPPLPPLPPTVDLIASAQGTNASATEIWTAAKAQRSELQDQVRRLEEQRRDLVQDLRRESTPDAAKPGIEARIKEVDSRLSATEQLMAQADLAVAKAAAVPGAVQEPRPIRRDGPPEELIAIPIVFTIFVLAPIAIAYARRIWKRGATVIAPVPAEVRQRLDQLGDAVESIALEVERIGEGQRFVTKVMTEGGRSLGAGAAQPLPVPQANAERVGMRPGA